MLDLIARLAIASTTLACSALAFVACDTDLASTPREDGALAIAEATLETGATVGWDFEVALETVAGQYPNVLDISVPVDVERTFATRMPRRPGGPDPRRLATAEALTRPTGATGEVRLLDAATHEVLFAAPIASHRAGDTTWVDVHLVDPCKARVICQRPFRLEVSWPAPTPGRVTADLTDAVSQGRVLLGR